MKKIFLLCLYCSPIACLAQYTYDNLQVNFLENETFAKSFTYGNLRLYPIKAKEKFKSNFKDLGKYTPLAEALEKKKIKITEKGNDGTVSSLFVENISNDTIIIMAGEIVKGGKQDRIINQDFLLLPNSGKKNLSVFCVESGRWTSRGRPSGNNFEGHYKVGSMSLRKVVEKDKDQSKVWSKVDEMNSKNSTTTSTKTYTALTNSNAFNSNLNGYVKYFTEKFSKENDVIGVIVVTGNKVLGCDMFATNQLFKQNFDNLLHSYATEAILNGASVTIANAAVKKYMDQLLSNEQQQEATLKEKGNSFSNKGKKIRVSSYE